MRKLQHKEDDKMARDGRKSEPVTQGPLAIPVSDRRHPLDKVVEQSKVIGLAVPAKPHIFQSDEELTKLFAECADEDRELANFGMSKYARLLNGEDRRR